MLTFEGDVRKDGTIPFMGNFSDVAKKGQRVAIVHDFNYGLNAFLLDHFNFY